MDLTPEKVSGFLDKDQKALYTLIWNRFLASQASPAIFDMTTANISCGKMLFRVTGSVLKFDGFLKIYSEEKEEEPETVREDRDDQDVRLPALKSGQRLT